MLEIGELSYFMMVIRPTSVKQIAVRDTSLSHKDLQLKTELLSASGRKQDSSSQALLTTDLTLLTSMLVNDKHDISYDIQVILI